MRVRLREMVRFQWIGIVFSFFIIEVSAQQFPGTPTSTWAEAGMKDSIPNYERVVNVLDYGADSTGMHSTVEIFKNIIEDNPSPLVIFFPRGKYYFDQPLMLREDVILRGEGSRNTQFEFDLSHAGSDLIIISGRQISSSKVRLGEIRQGISEVDIVLFAEEAIGWSDVYLTFNDSSLMSSSWAYGSAGGLYSLEVINNEKAIIASTFRIDIPVDLRPEIIPVDLISGVGLECFSIIRRDSTIFQSSNISFHLAKDCWVVGVESSLTNFAHIEVNRSRNLVIRGNYLNDAHAFGGGGQAYGLVVQYGSAHILAENNIFRKLRHSILMQAGANTNVMAYNYSLEPFWTGTGLPANSAGDLVCHGNYPYFNLFEGNIAQNIVLDASHGKNGPNNTFLRNRADLFGIFMSPGSNTDSTHFIGNEVTNTGFLMGLYSLIGSGNITYGNKVKGQFQPPGTSGDMPESYYLTDVPGFWDNDIWPRIGEQLPTLSSRLPAVSRWGKEEFTDCTTNPLYEGSTVNSMEIKGDFNVSFFPNPITDKVKINWQGQRELNFYVIDSRGRMMKRQKGSGQEVEIDFYGLPSGLYFTQIRDNLGNMLKVIKMIKF